MKRAHLLGGVLLCGLAGCYAPMGPLGHRPDLLFNLPVTQRAAAAAKPVAGPPLLVPMFSTQMTYPTGAFYNLQATEVGPLAHTYASYEPEAAFYEQFVEALRARGHNALRDYDPGRMPLPGDGMSFLRGEIRSLEIDSIHPDPEAAGGEDERTVYDAARARLVFKTYGREGQLGAEFAVIVAAKVRRDKDDVLRELGMQAALEVDSCLRGKGCTATPSAVAARDSDEPHADAWAALENARYGEGAAR